jgi:cell division transport system ATP-binding protein
MVRFEGVGLRYASSTAEQAPEALRNLTFTLPEGSFTWLLGASGAGKSSVLRLMHLAVRPTRGVVEVLGLRMDQGARRAALPALRRRIGVVFQDFRLLPYLPVFDNVALPLRLAGHAEASLRADVTEMLRWVGLEHKAGVLPMELSGGEQQRVAIARALAPRPPLVFADEPTGNLDAATGHDIVELLFARRAETGATLIIITHDEELAKRCDRVVTLADGHIASDTAAG